MPANEIILEATSLGRVVQTANGPKTIISDFSYTFQRGCVYCILGPSGAGKSSLLRLMNRLDSPTSGRVLFEGTDTSALSPCDLRRRMGYLFQTPYLFEGTATDNLLYANHELTRTQIEDLTAAVHINPDLLSEPVDGLSLGEKQRVALARLLATYPVIALLDEPTSALDPATTLAIENSIKSIVRQTGLSVIMVSHDPSQALRMDDQALLIAGGRLIEWGSADEVINSPKTELGRNYKERKLR